MNHSRLQRLERAMVDSECPTCAEPLILVEQIVICRVGDALEPPTPPSPLPGRCPRCGCDWSSRPRIVTAIRLEHAECAL
jgi:hypothetical protein